MSTEIVKAITLIFQRTNCPLKGLFYNGLKVYFRPFTKFIKNTIVEPDNKLGHKAFVRTPWKKIEVTHNFKNRITN